MTIAERSRELVTDPVRPRLLRATSLGLLIAGALLLMPYLAISANDVAGDIAGFFYDGATVVGCLALVSGVLLFSWSLFIRALPTHDPLRFDVVGALVAVTLVVGLVSSAMLLFALILNYDALHTEPLLWI